MIEAQRQAIVGHDPGTRLGEDPENLHQHRVASRRARAFLHATRAFVDPTWRRSLTVALRELGEVTGPVRDLDVLLDYVREEVGGLPEVDQRGASRSWRGSSTNAAGRGRNCLRCWTEIATGCSWRDFGCHRGLRPESSAFGLERVARKEFRRLAKTVARLGKHPADAAMHRLRIQLKRARYAAELASPGDAADRRFLDDAKSLQDLLGEYQDSLVAEKHLRLAAVVDDQTAAAFVAGRIAERQLARRLLVRQRLPDAWKRLRRSGARL